MLEHDLTLEELSQRTAIEPRTLRSWVSEGLLAPPLKAGRGALSGRECEPRIGGAGAQGPPWAVTVRNRTAVHDGDRRADPVLGARGWAIRCKSRIRP
ncbi:MerR family transcriptional regulator [Gemmobacter lanyuensis]